MGKGNPRHIQAKGLGHGHPNVPMGRVERGILGLFMVAGGVPRNQKKGEKMNEQSQAEYCRGCILRPGCNVILKDGEKCEDREDKMDEKLKTRLEARTDIWTLKRQDAVMGELRKISNSLHRLAEFQCNYGLTERQEKRQEKLEKDAEALAWTLGLRAYHQRDPRGCALYLVPESLTEDEMDSNYSSYMAVC